jgi:TP901 family phage tail tape measure protein
MALQVASLFGVLSLDDSNFRSGLSSAKTGLSSFGSDLQKAGASVTAISAPIASLFGVSVKKAADFDEAVRNTGAVLNLTSEQITNLSSELLGIGSNTRAGPQAVAEAFYDIAGGVADASTHMAILDAAIHTSQAGNANLQGTTSALISTMNSYGFAADEAGRVSDVLTQIVGKGVGTMDDFAGALPEVTGLAASLGIPLEDVGTMMSFLTTKGGTASQAATQLGANMSALMKPNEDMKDALMELGFESGEAAIKQLGLVGALRAVSATSTAGSEGMAALLGTQEAVRASVHLLSDGFIGFSDTFQSSIDGVTKKAEDIQMEGPSAQIDLFRSRIDALSITVGNTLGPALNLMLDTMKPIIDSTIAWIQQNPELTSQIGLLAIGGTLLGGGLFVLGTIFTGVSTVVGVLTGAVGFLLSPVGLLIAGIAGIIFAANELYPGGIAKLFMDAAVSATMLAGIFSAILGSAVQWVRDRFVELLNTVNDVLGKINEFANRVGAGAGGIGGIIQGLASGQFNLGQVLGAVGAEFGGARAGGGPVMGGGAYIVGERGPELFTPGSSGYVHSNDSMGGIQIGSIVINANTRAGGEAAMDGALARARAKGY